MKIFLFYALLLASPLRAAITLDSASAVTVGDSGGTTLSHTCSGDDRILIVSVAYVTSLPTVEYAGVAMTLAKDTTLNANPGAAIYYMVNPPTGAHNVVTGSSFFSYDFQAISWNGVDQDNPIGGTDGAANDDFFSPPVGLTATPAGSGDGIAVDCLMFGTFGPPNIVTPGAGQTSRGDLDSSGTNSITFNSSSKGQSGASTVMTWAFDPSDANYTFSALSAVTLKAAGATPPTPTEPVTFQGVSLRGVSVR